MSDENLVGQTIAGKYRVEKILGKGGMGVVVGARHLKLDEPVAIKLLRPAMMEVDGMVARFLREARASSKIKSEHVVRVTDVDTRDDGSPYMVMEYLTGNDFAEIVKAKGRLGVAEAVGVILEACDAISEAHELGIIHRDLKPSNLFLHARRDGRTVVKVLDFGISKLDAPGEQDATKTGQMMGSPKYMSPEQMLSMHDVDARTDIWSLGAILFDLLCGRPPFQADTTPRICALVLNADPPLPSTMRPDLPTEVEQIVLRCLDKEADHRFADVKALAEALRPYGPVAPDMATSGARPQVVVPEAPPLVIKSATATPAPGATVAAWDATRVEGTARQSSPARVAFAAAGLVVLGFAIALYTLRGHGSPPPVPAALSSAPSAPVASEPAAAVKPPVSPNDLPDAEPSATAAVTAKPALAAPSGKKPKPGPSADPFGGRRN
jgi:serine/threonine-protein kinase